VSNSSFIINIPSHFISYIKSNYNEYVPNLMTCTTMIKSTISITLRASKLMIKNLKV